MRASCQNPRASLVTQHSHLGNSSSLELGTVPPPVTCLFADWAWTRVFFAHFWAQWLVDLHLKHSPLLVLPLGEWLHFFGPLSLS